MKVGILVHGCYLSTNGWEKIMWGSSPHKLGRLPKAVLVTLDEIAAGNDVVKLVFGTGASEINGIKEGEYTRNYLIENANKLDKFDTIKNHKFFDILEKEGIKRFFEKKSIAEIKSKNTYEEVQEAGKIFNKVGVEKIVQISSPTHIMRCMKEACRALEEMKLTKLSRNLYATPSDTSYENSSANDVVIFEPRHRGDDPCLHLPIACAVSKIFKVKDMENFLKEFNILVKKYF